jgi:hypothetical protein
VYIIACTKCIMYSGIYVCTVSSPVFMKYILSSSMEVSICNICMIYNK